MTHQTAARELNIYKTIFENEFRLWSSAIYLFLKEIQKKTPLPAVDTRSIINIGSSSKFRAIRDIQISLPGGHVNVFIRHLDPSLRNSGGGHDRWSITDEGKIMLQIVNERTGELKEPKEFSLKELQDINENIRKIIFSMQLGCMIFLCNNQDIVEKLPEGKPKIKEIEMGLEAFANDIFLSVEKFSLDNEAAEIVLQVKKPSPGKAVGIFMSNAAPQDVLTIRKYTRAWHHVMDVLKGFRHAIQSSGRVLNSVKITLKNAEGGQWSEAVFDKNALRQLDAPCDKSNPPKPTSGNLPEGFYIMSIDSPVPKGRGKLMQPIYDDQSYLYGDVERNDKCPCGSGINFKKCHAKKITKTFDELLADSAEKLGKEMHSKLWRENFRRGSKFHITPPPPN